MYICCFTCYKDVQSLQAPVELLAARPLQKPSVCPELSCCRTLPPCSCKSICLNTIAIMHVSCCPLHLDYCPLLIWPIAYYLYAYYAS